LIFEHLFPHNHLEIAQVLQFKAAVLSALERHAEADQCEEQASQIEDDIAAGAARIERLVARLPELAL
jgi:hypothetical protein